MSKYIGSSAVNLSTTSADVTGNADIDGNLTVGGNLTVSGTTITVDHATAQTVDLGDNDKIRLGADYELQLWSDGTTGQISGDINHTGSITTDGLTVDGNAEISASRPILDMMCTGASNENLRIDVNVGTLRFRQLNDAKDSATERFHLDTNTGDISFYDTSGNAKFFWDASASSLGIGTSSLDNKVNIQESALSGRSASNGNTSMTIEHATDTGIQFFSATQTQLRFGDAASSGAGSIIYEHSTDKLRLNTGALTTFEDDGVERMRITSAGVVEMYGNSSSTLYLKSSSPILAFTDTNSFPDANDRFQIRGTSSDGIAAGSMGFYDSSADTTSTYFTIRDDGKIGIRNTTPTAIGLQVGGDPSGTVAPSMSISLPDEGGTNTSLAIRGGSPTIFFDQTGGGNGKFLMDSADIAFKSGTMQSEGSELVRIRWDGGITFNGDTAAANALNDYEEGTWTPGVSSGTITAVNAKYTKIGRSVTVSALIYNISDRSSSNVFTITNLPYASCGACRSVGAIMMRYQNNTSLTAAYITQNTTNVEFYGVTSGGWDVALHSDWNNINSEVYFTATYNAD